MNGSLIGRTSDKRATVSIYLSERGMGINHEKNRWWNSLGNTEVAGVGSVRAERLLKRMYGIKIIVPGEKELGR